MASLSARSATARWIAIGSITALAVVVGVLAVSAYRHANPEIDPGGAAPVPTFTLGVQSASPTPTPTAVAPRTRDTERFFAAGSTQWWRATAGACGGPEPLIERSPDAGATWIDVTPRYRGIAQVQSLEAFSAQDAEMVAAMEGCDTQALRTFTRGEFWESYPEVLAASRFIDATDAATVQLPSGPVDAPCDTASGLRAAGDAVALVCEARAWTLTDDEWMPLPVDGALTLALDGPDVVVAHTSPSCDGVAITRVSAGAAAGSACLEVDAAAPLALDATGDEIVVWSGESIARVTLGR